MIDKTGWETAVRKYGPLVFSHFFRTLGDEQEALRATRAALLRLEAIGFSSDLEVVRWVRGLGRLRLVSGDSPPWADVARVRAR